MPDAPTAWLIPDWPAPPNVRAVTTTRAGLGGAAQSKYGFNLGTRCGDDPAAVARNRAYLHDALSLPSEPSWLRQVHATRAVVEPTHDEPEADAAVTRTPGVVLAIQTADCLPVLFCADDGSEIAAAHAGWRGLSGGVLENTLHAMRTPRANVVAWLGPAIAAKSYEVGDEVRDVFLAHDPAAASAFTTTRPRHWLCDLYELARQHLRAAGVTRIFGGGCDTFTDPRLHSYRRDGASSGRMASLVWMRPVARKDDDTVHVGAAKKDDLDAACLVIAECRTALEAQGLLQWDSKYPNRAFFQEALAAGNLLLLLEGKSVCGVAVLNGEQPPEWSAAQWHHKDAPFMVIHAFAVAPRLQSRGHGKLLLDFCEDVARNRGCQSIRIDVFSENSRALRFWERHGYRSRGEARFASKPAGHQRYFCYEKSLARPSEPKRR